MVPTSMMVLVPFAPSAIYIVAFLQRLQDTFVGLPFLALTQKAKVRGNRLGQPTDKVAYYRMCMLIRFKYWLVV